MNAIARTAGPNLGLVFLRRASAKLTLVEANELAIDAALVDLLEPFENLFAGPMGCQRCRAADDARRAQQCQRASSPPTPQATIDAILHCVRERGPSALREPANVERLSRCDEAAKATIDHRIAKFTSEKEFAGD
jgi:hypothetical protein